MNFSPWGFGSVGHVFTAVIAGLWFILVFVVAVGVLFLLVRFLLVATRAAQLYVAKNAPAAPVATVPPVAKQPAAPADAATSSVVPPPSSSPTSSTSASSTSAVTKPISKPGTTAATKPVSKPRTPRTPPTA